MIRNENEYKEAVSKLQEEARRIDLQQRELVKMGLSPEEIERALDPVKSFHLQLIEEKESYERLKRGEVDELKNLRGLGHLLICLRIATGTTQQDLAERLGVHQSQISRDERNEYHGITLERAAKVLDALGVRLRIKAEIPQPDGELVAS